MKRTLSTICAGLTLVGALGSVNSASARRAPAYPLVFSSTRDGNAGLYLLQRSGITHIASADSPGHDCGPAITTNGHHLVMSSNRLSGPFEPADPTGTYTPLNFDLYLLDIRTGVAKQLTTNVNNDMSPSWAPNGRKIAFAREQPNLRYSIWTINRNGSHLTQLTHGDERLSHMNPAWSPDGRKIAYTVADATSPGRSSIYVMDANGTNNRLLTDSGEFPAWSPDSRRIVFASSRDGLHPFDQDLYVMRANGSRQQRITQIAGSEVMPNWSPDGDHIAYVHDEDYWTGHALVTTLPTGTGIDAFVSGPKPANVWQLSLSKGGPPQQLTTGVSDLFPHYSPSMVIG